MTRLYRMLFWTVAHIGRPIGGIRPRRWTDWLAQQAFSAQDLEPSAFRWYRDRYGSALLLHPHFLLDRAVIAFGVYDHALHLFIESQVKSGMVCFDVGANIGEVALHMARKTGPSGKVHAFEPVPGVRARLARHVEQNALGDVIIVHPLALSNVTGRTTFLLAQEAFPNQGMGSLVDRDNPNLTARIDVETMTIDEFCAANAIDRIDFMKIDIQGAEPLLLEGGPKTFGSLGPDLLMEVAPRCLKTIGKDSRDLIRAIEDYGYMAYELDGTVPGRRVRADSISGDHRMDNVFCTKR